MTSFVEIHKDNTSLLATFIQYAGKALESFRYYNKRDFGVIDNHLVTILLKNSMGEPIGYGHLDKENDIVWLGIAIIEKEMGKGYGKLVMDKLLFEAKKKEIHTIFLTVDKKNHSAIGLYKRFGFVVESDLGDRIKMKNDLAVSR